MAARHEAPGLGTCGEEEALRAGSSCRRLSNWAETGPRNLGKPTSACQAINSDTAGQSGLVNLQCTGKCLRDEPPVRGMDCLGLPRVPDLLGCGRAEEVSCKCPFSYGESSVQPLSLWHSSRYCQIFQTSAFVLDLRPVKHTCPPS